MQEILDRGVGDLSEFLLEMDEFRGQELIKGHPIIRCYYQTGAIVELTEKEIEQVVYFITHHNYMFWHQYNDANINPPLPYIRRTPSEELSQLIKRKYRRDCTVESILLMAMENHIPKIVKLLLNEPENVMDYMVKYNYYIPSSIFIKMSKKHIPQIIHMILRDECNGVIQIVKEFPECMLDDKMLSDVLNYRTCPSWNLWGKKNIPSILYDRNYLINVLNSSTNANSLRSLISDHLPEVHIRMRILNNNPKYVKLNEYLTLTEIVDIENNPSQELLEKFVGIEDLSEYYDIFDPLTLAKAFTRIKKTIPYPLNADPAVIKYMKYLRSSAKNIPKKYLDIAPKQKQLDLTKKLVGVNRYRFSLIDELDQETAQLYYKANPHQIFPSIQPHLTAEMVLPHIEKNLKYISKIENIELLSELNNTYDVKKYVCTRVLNKIIGGSKKSARKNLNMD